MKRIAKRLTYANVISTLALFLVLGGASALAAAQLAKNSVGAKQLKNGAVSTAKIKDGAVTGAKIKDGTLSGAKLDLGSLGQVPSAASAANAANAANAGHATSADNANTVGGQTVQKISWVVPKKTPMSTIFSAVGLVITGSCNASGEISVNASTTAGDAELHLFGDQGGAFFQSENSSFSATSLVHTPVNGFGNQEGSGSFVYGTASGHAATMTYGFDFANSFGTKNVGCGFFGQIIYG